ncbi:hypothetical protein LIA77_10062 [Sarocladium implicatum]|nr:hypothetical protein LIA77_10062 [Sarocladium implicatum]
MHVRSRQNASPPRSCCRHALSCSFPSRAQLDSTAFDLGGKCLDCIFTGGRSHATLRLRGMRKEGSDGQLHLPTLFTDSLSLGSLALPCFDMPRHADTYLQS